MASPDRRPAAPPRSRRIRTVHLLLGFAAAVLALELASRGPVTIRGRQIDYGRIIANELSSQTRPPTIVFLGSSHAQCDVVPAVIERHLGWPRGAVVNAGFVGAGPGERLRLYHRAEPALGQARLVVVETAPFDFNLNLARQERERADLHARLILRTADADPLHRADLWLGQSLALWRERYTWYDLAVDAGHAALARAGIDRRASLFDDDGYPKVGGVPGTEEMLARNVELAIHRHYQDYAFDEEAARDLVSLVEHIESHGTRVLLVDYPATPAYRAVAESRYPEAQRLWRATLEARLPGRPLLRLLAVPGRVGGDFRDADHLVRAGAIRLSGLIAEWPEVALLRGPSPPTSTPVPGPTGSLGRYRTVSESTSGDAPGGRPSP